MKEYLRQLLIKGAYDAGIPPFKWLTKKFVSSDEHLLVELFKRYNVDLVIDIGANLGQYSKSLLKSGYRGRIISFEPLSAAFQHLQEINHYYPNWDIRKLAVGDKDETTTINVSAYSASSSLLEMNKNHLDAAPDTAYTSSEAIEVVRLDSVFESIKKEKATVFLKIDTQGFEKAVLDGASHSLPKVVGLQIEMSFQELYNGETLFRPMFDRISDLGFSLCHLHEGLRNPHTGQLLQVDAVFFRTGQVS